MDKYALARLVQWAGPGGLQGRKRLQKVVYLLQQEGFPCDAEYSLHYYGPYSRDLAEACDAMVSADLLDEHAGVQYGYTLSADGAAALADADIAQTERRAALDRFGPRAADLLRKDPWLLELGSTIHYFRVRSPDWDEAVKRACRFKKTAETHPSVPEALALAQTVYEQSGGR